MQGPMNRPTSVTVIAWVWIILGGAMALSGSLGATAGDGQAFELYPEHMAAIKAMNAAMRWIVLFQAALGLVGLVGGVFLLRLRAWARTTLEACSWVLFVYWLSFLSYLTYAWVSMASGMEVPGGANGLFMAVFGVVGVVGTAFFCVPIAIMIRVLRSRRVRDAVRGGAAA